MGVNYSSLNPVNYNCPVCQKSGRLPNIAGKFFILNANECQCNGCNTIFNKKTYYNPGIISAQYVESINLN